MAEFNDYNFDIIIQDICEERIKQDYKFGRKRELAPIEWLPALVEEVGEFAKEVCDMTDFPGNMRKELVQIAALSIAIIQDLDSQHTGNEEWDDWK